MSGLSGGVDDLEAGYGHACALLCETARCGAGGENRRRCSSAIGTTTQSRLTPCRSRGERDQRRRRPSPTGAFHTCAVLADGTVRCWGAERHQGQLGDGTMDECVEPRGGERPHGCLCRGSRGRSHVCAARGRHAAVLGRQRVRATRRRDEHAFVHAGAGVGNHWRCRRERRVATYLRGPGERHRGVLGTERVLTARQRHDDELGHSGTGSLESPAPPRLLRDGGTAAARSLAAARCGAGETTSGASSVTAPRPAPPRQQR